MTVSEITIDYSYWDYHQLENLQLFLQQIGLRAEAEDVEDYKLEKFDDNEE